MLFHNVLTYVMAASCHILLYLIVQRYKCCLSIFFSKTERQGTGVPY